MKTLFPCKSFTRCRCREQRNSLWARGYNRFDFQIGSSTLMVSDKLAGSYTFAKTLEHKAKQGLNVGKEITVVPPTEYQVRFRGALEGYFLACPGLFLSFLLVSLLNCLWTDKWTKPSDDVDVISDPNLLSSVL
jgi:hypothetical protein